MMNTEITKATAAEYDDVVDFGNLVFGIDFKKTLPKLYDSHPELSACHHIVKEDGKIKAMVGSFPLSFAVGEKTLSAMGIGTVSVHLYARSRGYMKTLMKNALKEAQEVGADFLCLGGQKQRYQYFGFENDGTALSFTVTPTNRRHLKVVSTEGVSLVPLDENGEFLKDAIALHNAQPVHGIRPDKDFLEVASNWTSRVYAFLKDNVFFGYMSLSENKDFAQEFYLTEPAFTLNAVFAAIEKFGKSLRINLGCWQKEEAKLLQNAAESISISDAEMFNVLNYPRFVEAFLSLKGKYQALADGERVYEVRDRGERFEISVKDGEVSVRETDKAPDVSLNHLQMMNHLFSPAHTFLYDSQPERSWLPIPVCLPNADMV